MDVMLKNEEKVSSITGLVGYNEAINELVKIAKQKKDDLDHQCLLASNQLKQIQENLIRERNEFDIWKRQEKERFQQEMNVLHNAIVEKENTINIGISNMESRSRDLKVRETQMVQIEEDKRKLNDERIEIERLRNSAVEKLNEVKQKSSELSSSISSLSYREKEIKDKSIAIEEQNRQLSVREQALIKNKEDMDQKIKNLESLKLIVDPKIAEIDSKTKELQSLKKEMDEQNAEINRRIEEDKAMVRAIEERDMKLKMGERDLASREEELKRAMLVKNVSK